MNQTKRVLLTILALSIFFVSCSVGEMRPSGIEEYEAVPSEFLSNPSASFELLEYQDWVIFTLTGHPSGIASDGTHGGVGLTVNKFVVDIATAGLTRDQILNQVVAAAGEVEGYQALVDYPTGRVLVLSVGTAFILGIDSHDSGIDLGWETMGG